MCHCISVSIMMDSNKNKQYLIAYVVSLAAVAVGTLASWPGPVMPKLQNNETDIRITTDQMAWMVSISSPGFIAGSFVTRYLSDRLGRRATILASACPILIGTIAVIFAIDPWLLCLARFLWGVGTGIYSTVVTLYLAEIADKEIRGALAIVSRYMFNFGNLLVMCVGPAVSFYTLNYLILALPVIYFVACWWVPESPYYCLKENKVDAARKAMKQIRKYEDEKALEDDLQQLKADVKNEMRHASTLKEMITGKKYRRALIIAAGLKASQLLTGQLVIAEYLGLIMLESGTDIQLFLIFIIYGVVRFVTSIMSSMLADRLGRRPLLIYSYLGAGISLCIIGVYFFLLEVLQFSRESMKPYSFIPFAGIIVCNIISTLGYYSVIVVVPAEIFPLNIKAIAMTCFNMFGGLLHFGVARGYQGLKDVAGLCGVFWVLGVSGILGSIFTVLYVPETKGKSLREIQEFLQGDLYEYDEVCIKLQPVGNYDLDSEKNHLEEAEDKELLEQRRKITIAKT